MAGQLTAQAASGGFAFAVGGAHRRALESTKSGDVLVGIRPQHLRVVIGGAAGQIAEARVEAFEALGATGVLIAETGGVALTVLTSPEDDFEPGQPVRLALDVDQFLYFDAAQGRNLQA
jgi:ABC-type sugar transport system ATPase subunit